MRIHEWELYCCREEKKERIVRLQEFIEEFPSPVEQLFLSDVVQ